MIEFRETEDENSIEVVVDGIWRGHLQRHEGRPRLAIAGIDTIFSLVELGQITARLTAFAAKK